MRKLIYILVILFAYSNLMFSISGDGTEGNPYQGTIDANTTWNTGDVIFADDIEILSGFTLTISPGAFSGTFLNMNGSTLTIDLGGAFILDPQASATIYNIVNNGTLILESYSNEPGVASLKHFNYSGTGVSQMKLYLSGGPVGVSYKWHYISLPVTGVTSISFNTPNLVQYVESLATSTDNYPGWIAHDGFQYSTDLTLPAYAFPTLIVGKGYNYYSAASTTFTFTGTINISDVTATLSYSGSSDFQGYNLIGNPFSSCLDWDLLVSGGSLRSVNDAIYFTNRGQIASYVGGIGTSGGTAYIPPMQGFFVKASASNGRVILSSAARTHNLDQLRYKKKSAGDDYMSSDTISFVRLKLESPEDSTDLVVRFNTRATIAFDKALDAFKFSKTAGDINIWTTTGNVDYSINGLPFPVTTLEIPVGVNVKTTSTFKLSSSELNKLDNYTVTLKDLVTNITVDLKKGESVEFNASSGLIDNRFILAIANTTTSIPEISLEDKKFRIYSLPGIINILSLTDEVNNLRGPVTIYDMTGRKVLQRNNIEWNGIGDLKQIMFNSAGPGMYIVEVKVGSMKYVEKVSLR